MTMRVFRWKPVAVAVGAVLAFSGYAGAQDRTVRLAGTASMAGGSSAADTMTLGGKGTIESALNEDTELTRYYGGGYRGGFAGGYRGGYAYRGGYGYRGGYAYRGGYYGGYRGGYYGGYRGYGYRGWGYGYRPYYGLGLGYGLGYLSRGYGYGGYGYGGGYYSSYSYPYYYSSGYCGISATQEDLNTQAMPLNATASGVPIIRMPSTQAQPAAPTGDGTFRYDGGPSAPVPQPLTEPTPVAPQPVPPPIPASDDIRVALQKDKPKAVKTAYTFKAFGEK